MHELAGIFHALSDETRLRVLKLLEKGELCVCDIFSALDMVQPKVSFHLAVLRDAGLITDRKEGRWVRYKIQETDMFRRFLILSALEKISDDDVSEDRKRLEVFLAEKGNKVMDGDLPVAGGRKKKCCGN
jgi:ArsR family transcriptional regulator